MLTTDRAALAQAVAFYRTEVKERAATVKSLGAAGREDSVAESLLMLAEVGCCRCLCVPTAYGVTCAGACTRLSGDQVLAAEPNAHDECIASFNRVVEIATRLFSEASALAAWAWLCRARYENRLGETTAALDSACKAITMYGYSRRLLVVRVLCTSLSCADLVAVCGAAIAYANSRNLDQSIRGNS